MAKKIRIKPQLCKEFGITERTLSYLTKLGLINLEWQRRNGLLVVELSKADEEVLSYAKNCTYNDHAFRLPFQRFLWLRFMQMPLELLEFELEQKNLLNTKKYGPDYLQQRYDQFRSGIPKVLDDCLDNHRPPKTKEEIKAFEILLSVTELRTAYENPEWDEKFEFMCDSNVKTIIDCCLSTSGSYADIQDMLHELLGIKIPVNGLIFYQELMHDLSLMNTDDIKNYLTGISPSRRQEFQAAYGSSLANYKLRSGLQMSIKTTEVVSIALEQISKKIINITKDSSMVDPSEVYNAIKTFNILSDRHTQVSQAKEGSNKGELTDFFKQLKLKERDPAESWIQISEEDQATLEAVETQAALREGEDE